MRLARLSDPDDGATLVFGEPVVGVLDTTADHDYFFVELNAGDTIVIDARSAALDPRVFAGTDTTGLRFLQGDDDGGRGLLELDARLIYTAEDRRVGMSSWSLTPAIHAPQATS